MYAVVRAGGKQYKVQAGELLRVEKLELDLGSEFDLPEVLMVGGSKTFVGNPTLSDAKVRAVVTRQGKSDKVIVFKKKRRQGYRRMTGHRQPFTEIFIKSITSPEGQTVEAQKDAPVFDSAKKQSKDEKRKAQKAEAKKPGAEPKVRKVAKKAAKKASGKRKKTGKKSAAKKAGGKKAAKKKAKKS